MEFKPLNFPTKVFYSDEKNQVFVFYRQGQAFSVNVKNLCCQEPSYKKRDSLKNLIEQQDLDFTKNAKKCQDSATY